MLKYEYIFQVKYTEAISSNSTRKLLWFEITIMLIAVKNKYIVLFIIIFGTLLCMLWRCWLGGRKGIRPVKTEWSSAGMVICLERGADLHMAQLMPLPLTVSCFSKIQIGFYRAILCIRGTSHGPVSVCLSVTSRCSIETAERTRIELWASFHPSYTVLKGYSVISKNKGTSLWNIVLNSGVRKFRHSISIVETCYQLSSRKVDAQSVTNWAVVGQLSR